MNHFYIGYVTDKSGKLLGLYSLAGYDSGNAYDRLLLAHFQVGRFSDVPSDYSRYLAVTLSEISVVWDSSFVETVFRG